MENSPPSVFIFFHIMSMSIIGHRVKEWKIGSVVLSIQNELQKKSIDCLQTGE